MERPTNQQDQPPQPRQLTRPFRERKRGKRDPVPTKSAAETRTDLAIEVLDRLLAISEPCILIDHAEALSRRPPYSRLFPGTGARTAIESAVQAAPEIQEGEQASRERLERVGVFVVVRACKSHILDVDSVDASAADRCLGPLLALVAVALRRTPSLAPDAVRRRRLVVSLDARVPEAWLRTKRAQGESVLTMAYRASLRTRVRLLNPEARELDEDVASIAFALSRREKDPVVALPQVAIGELLDAPHQRISESIDRLVRARFLTRLAKGDPVSGMAATYRIRTRNTAGIFQVFDRQ